MNSRYITVAERTKLFRIPVDEVIRLEARGVRTIVYTITGQLFIHDACIGALCDEYKEIIFRSHRSHAVHVGKIKYYDRRNPDIVVMNDGSMPPLSRRNRASLVKLLKGQG